MRPRILIFNINFEDHFVKSRKPSKKSSALVVKCVI